MKFNLICIFDAIVNFAWMFVVELYVTLNSSFQLSMKRICANNEINTNLHEILQNSRC